MRRAKTIKYNSRKLSGWLLVMLLVLVSVSPGFAQSPEQPTEAQQANFGGPDTVPNRIEAERVDKDTLFEFEFMKPYYEWNIVTVTRIPCRGNLPWKAMVTLALLEFRSPV
jgi:hypothetical protein